jgi:hypothetical protein
MSCKYKAAPRRSLLLINLLHNSIAGCPQTVQYFCAIKGEDEVQMDERVVEKKK